MCGAFLLLYDDSGREAVQVHPPPCSQKKQITPFVSSTFAIGVDSSVHCYLGMTHVDGNRRKTKRKGRGGYTFEFFQVHVHTSPVL